MSEKKLAKTNNVRVIGKLTNADVNLGTDKNGKEYVRAVATIVSNLDGQDNEFDVHFFSYKKTKDGKDIKFYDTYSNLDKMVNKRIRVDGSFTENRYWSKNRNQLASRQDITGTWVNEERSNADEATFILEGFVVKALTEKRNKADEVYLQAFTLGQANWNDTMAQLFEVHIKPDNYAVINGVSGYEVGDTVKVRGDLRFTTTTVEVEDEDAGFGAPVMKKYTNRQRNYYMTTGSNPFSEDTEGFYDTETVKTLIQAYKDNDIKISSNAASSTPATPVTETPRVTKRQQSLI